MEEHRHIFIGPREIDILAKSFGCRDSILQRSFVEHVGRKFRKARVHAVLDLKADGPIAKQDEALKQRLC